MLISEVFYSIQGEGELTGVPSVFIRTSGCNLRCTWCDTKYSSWFPEGEDLSISEIVDQVETHRARHCVLTGGEPMIAKGIRELAERLHKLGLHVTIETAGTLMPSEIACDLASISPKLSTSTPDEAEIGSGWSQRHEDRRLQPEVLRQWIDEYPYQLKFVVKERQDLVEIQELLRLIDRPIPAEKILLMPEGVDPASLQARSELLVELCKTHGYRLCTRLHIDLFGNRKGT